MSQERNQLFNQDRQTLQITKLRTSTSEQKLLHLPPIDQQQTQNSVYFNYYIVERKTGIAISSKERIHQEKERRREKIQEILKKPKKSYSSKRLQTDMPKKHLIDISIHPYFSIQMPLAAKSLKQINKQSNPTTRKDNICIYPEPLTTYNSSEKLKLFKKPNHINYNKVPNKKKCHQNFNDNDSAQYQQEVNTEYNIWTNSNTFDEEDTITEYVKQLS